VFGDLFAEDDLFHQGGAATAVLLRPLNADKASPVKLAVPPEFKLMVLFRFWLRTQDVGVEPPPGEFSHILGEPVPDFVAKGFFLR
jgi:hypothetical protein